MRKKLEKEEKRSKILGIKVQHEVYLKIKFIAEREATTISSYVNEILTKKIDEYFAIARINWDELPPEERG